MTDNQKTGGGWKLQDWKMAEWNLADYNGDYAVNEK